MSTLSSIEPYIEGEIDPAYALRMRFIFDAVMRSKPERILDLGCGRGLYLHLLSRLNFPVSIDGLDSAPGNLAAARRLCEGQANVCITQGSADLLPYADQSLDFVICSEVLEHLAQPELAIREIDRVLKTEGTLALTVPNLRFPFLWDPLNWCLMRFFGTHINKDRHWLAGIWADHERLYDMPALRQLLGTNFEVTDYTFLLRHCWPFSHFLLYGIGKNLVEYGVTPGLNRFSAEKPGLLRNAAAKIMALPHQIMGDYVQDSEISVNLALTARKLSRKSFGTAST